MNSSKRILIVDDDPDIALMLKIMLEYRGFSSLLASRPDMVDQILSDNNVELIIMDMLLSGANGTDICRSIKANPVTAPIPVIMISAHPNAREICLAAGADEFVSKPFDMEDLFSRIKKLTENVDTQS
jgi:DNA-binding response OmpR family regulator